MFKVLESLTVTPSSSHKLPETPPSSYMGYIGLDGYLAKKLSLFLEVWTLIASTLTKVGLKPKRFLAQV